jgi:hypothetical protein
MNRKKLPIIFLVCGIIIGIAFLNSMSEIFFNSSENSDFNDFFSSVWAYRLGMGIATGICFYYYFKIKKEEKISD